MNAAVAALFGAGVGCGIAVIVHALRPRPVPLAAVAAALDRPHHPTGPHQRGDAYPGLTGWQQPVGRFGTWLIATVGFVDTGALTDSLRVLDKPLERHGYEKVLGAAVGFTLPVATAAAIGASAGAVINPLVVLVASGVLAAAGFVYPDLPLAEQVEQRRQAFRHALSSYLDLVTIILAGGGAIETALVGAADAGDGWAFTELRGALRRAELTRRSPWETFAELGEQLGVDELTELAANVALAGQSGAKIRQSLIAKADAMRIAQIAEIEAAAETQTEKMIVPVVVLIMGLVLFIGYGAVDAMSTPGTTFDTPTDQNTTNGN